EGEAAPGTPAEPSEGEASGEGLAEQEETGSVTTWTVIGGGVLLLLVTMTGLVLVKNARRASNRQMKDRGEPGNFAPQQDGEYRSGAGARRAVLHAKTIRGSRVLMGPSSPGGRRTRPESQFRERRVARSRDRGRSSSTPPGLPRQHR